MIRRTPQQGLSPADRAHIRLLRQEAKARRIERLIEQAIKAQEEAAECMKGDVIYMPSVLHHHGTQWECAELMRINAARLPSGICYSLPTSAYEARSRTCMGYVDANLT